MKITVDGEDGRPPITIDIPQAPKKAEKPAEKPKVASVAKGPARKRRGHPSPKNDRAVAMGVADWKRQAVSILDLTEEILVPLYASGIESVGQLHQYGIDHRGYVEIPDISEAQSDTITGSINTSLDELEREAGP